jgi:hypothetical protein
LKISKQFPYSRSSNCPDNCATSPGFTPSDANPLPKKFNRPTPVNNRHQYFSSNKVGDKFGSTSDLTISAQLYRSICGFLQSTASTSSSFQSPKPWLDRQGAPRIHRPARTRTPGDARVRPLPCARARFPSCGPRRGWKRDRFGFAPCLPRGRSRRA